MQIQSIADVRVCASPLVGFGSELMALKEEFERFLNERVYRHHQVLRMAAQGKTILGRLFGEFVARPDLLPERHQARWTGAPDSVLRRAGPSVTPREASLQRVVVDYLAGMTDRFARREYLRLFRPDGDL
jgi:dGTPase